MVSESFIKITTLARSRHRSWNWSFLSLNVVKFNWLRILEVRHGKRSREGTRGEAPKQLVSYTVEKLVAVNPYIPDILPPDLDRYVNDEQVRPGHLSISSLPTVDALKKGHGQGQLIVLPRNEFNQPELKKNIVDVSSVVVPHNPKMLKKNTADITSIVVPHNPKMLSLFPHVALNFMFRMRSYPHPPTTPSYFFPLWGENHIGRKIGQCGGRVQCKGVEQYYFCHRRHFVCASVLEAAVAIFRSRQFGHAS
ncbi:hypothetical protein NE237_024838 [Protea cynaroides]|uniref:Uncharacterized protein n=1 Tax=Protea cynaroides TaxID=273540 RepID=A0A9Q0H0S5_9MAGN|nr:hypothetical protein NE237_024838 [Protea cynaroides]